MFKTHDSLWFDSLHDHSILGDFRCATYFYIEDGKSALRVKKGVFMDYAPKVMECMIWCLKPKGSKFIVSRDVILNE